MVNEIFINNREIIYEAVKNLPPELYSSFNNLITILKAVGIAFIIYLFFLIANIIMNIRRNMMIKRIYEKVNGMEEKLSKVLKKNYKRR